MLKIHLKYPCKHGERERIFNPKILSATFIWLPFKPFEVTYTGLGSSSLEGTNRTLCSPGLRRKEHDPTRD